ncbi:MMPL family transporter [Tomitella gaofuii]|uniref:MMPL family transporter n=1 Tax=Tomitella gaofuii TaxID=2760083 RepID=UPI0015FB7898|nr:MMPL family transporter [Tomitella gaofuii]
MASILFRVGRFCFRHKWWIIAAWLAALIAVASMVQAFAPKFAKDFSLPGTDAGIATEQMQDYFPQVMTKQENASTSVLIQADDGLSHHTEQIDALVADLKGLPEVSDPASIANPVAVAEAQPQLAPSVLGDDGRVGLIQVDQDINMMDLTVDNKTELTDILDEHRGGGLQVEATGALMQVMSPGGSAELIGFAVAFVVMVVAFGALIAAFIPLVTGLLGVGLTIMLFTLGAEFLSINESAISIITMLGIAVSIDYALFIVSRYRSELQRGGTKEDAAGRAVGTAGSAVIFAGLTVIIAVVALSVVGIPMITQMGAGAGMAVAVAVLAAITFIPALLGAFGRVAFLPRIPWIKHADPSAGGETNGVRFGRTIVRRPIPVIIGGLVLLALAAIPMSKLELGLSMESDDEVAALDLMSEGFGEGVNGPLFAVLHSDDGNVAGAADAAVSTIATLDDVANPQALTWVGNGTTDPANPNVGADSALIMITPESAPASQQTHDLMENIRDIAPEIEAQGAELHVGGQTAIMSDLSAKLDTALIPYLVVVVGLAFLIMIGVFRSLWVPLVGTVGFIFSVLGAFGVTVAVFQEGWLGIISHTQPILSFLPIMLIGLVFGLAMDYQVFLVTRMREEYMHGMNAKDAIIAGYRHGARVVTSAALIMISVFAAFILSPDTTAKMIGFALAIAVFFDAFIIRMMVVPAVLALLGDRAWRLPKWLDKLVLNFDIEGGAIKDRGLEAVPAGEGGADGNGGQPVPVGSR